MASKKRGGLSKREYAAQQKGGSLDYKSGKISTSAKPKTVIPSGSKVASYESSQMAIPMDQRKDTAANRAAYNDFGSTVEVSKDKNTEFSSKNKEDKKKKKGDPEPSRPPRPSLPNVRETNQNSTPTGLGRVLQVASDPFGIVGKSGYKEKWNTAKENLGIDVTDTLGIDDWLRGAAGIKTADAGYFPQIPVDPNQDRLGAESTIAPTQSPIGTGFDPIAPVANPWGPGAGAGGNSGGAGAGGHTGGAGASSGGTVDSMGYSGSEGKKGGKKENDPYDEYKDLLEMAKREQESAFMDLLNQVDPTFEGYQKDYQTAQEEAMLQEQQALLARQMSYGTADSEQREQAEARMRQAYDSKRQAFMNQLAREEANQRASIGSQRANALSAMTMEQARAALDAYKYEQAMRQQEFENQMARQRQSLAGANASSGRQQEINSWLDQQAQEWVNSGEMEGDAWNIPDFGRENIVSRAASMFGGNPGDYAQFFPDNWENRYIQNPGYNFNSDPITGKPIGYDPRTGRLIR